MIPKDKQQDSSIFIHCHFIFKYKVFHIFMSSVDKLENLKFKLSWQLHEILLKCVKKELHVENLRLTDAVDSKNII